MHVPNVTRVHRGIGMHTSCVYAQISGHVIKGNKVKTSTFILKQLDYSPSTSMRDRNPEFIDWLN